jgi:hypothetical protein
MSKIVRYAEASSSTCRVCRHGSSGDSVKGARYMGSYANVHSRPRHGEVIDFSGERGEYGWRS